MISVCIGTCTVTSTSNGIASIVNNTYTCTYVYIYIYIHMIDR